LVREPGYYYRPDTLIGNAGDFNGDGPSTIKYGEVGAGLFPNLGTDDFSVALWVNTSSADSSDQFIGNKVAGTDGFAIRLDGAGQVAFLISDGVTILSVTSNDIVTDGDWRHITASRTGGFLELHIYNRATGTTDSTTSSTSDPSMFVGSSSPLFIGAQNSVSGNYDGLLDDIRVYKRAISNADSAELISLAGSEQVLSINNTVTISDSGSPVVITNSDLLTVDSDTPDVDLVYVIQLLPGASELTLNGTPLTNGMSFTQADINNGLLSIAATGLGGATSDSIAISVDDGQGADTLFALDVDINPNVEQTVSKNTSVTVDFAGAPLTITNNELLTVDPDNTDSELEYVLSVQQPTNVDIAISGSTLLVGDSFTQSDINNGLLSVVSTAVPGPPSGEYVYFTVDDGVGQVTNTFIYVNINTAPLNTAPLAGSAIFSVIEDDPNPAGETIDNLVGPVFTDADAGDSMLGILVNSAPNPPVGGEWQYSTDGTNWYAMGVVSDTNALALSSTSLIRFLPDTDFNGTPANLYYRVLDSTYTGPNFPVNFTDGAIREQVSAVPNGGNTAISANTGYLQVNVIPLNDSPTLGNSTFPSFDEDSSPVLTTVQDVFGPLFSDPDTGDTLSAIAIVDNPPTFEGEWAYSDNGSTWFYVSTVSPTAALVIAEDFYIRFLSATDYNGSPPALEVHALDSTYTGGTTVGNIYTRIDTTQYGFQRY